MAIWLVPVIAGLFFSAIIKKEHPAAESWAIVGANILREFYIKSTAQQVARIAVAAIAHLLVATLLLVTITLWRPVATYETALSVAGLVATCFYMLGSIYSVPFMLNPLLPQAARLRLMATVCMPVTVVLTLLFMGNQDWPLAIHITVGTTSLAVNCLIPLALLIMAGLNVGPAVRGDQRRIATEQHMLEWQRRYCERASLEIRGLQLAQGSSVSIPAYDLACTLDTQLQNQWVSIVPLANMPGLAQTAEFIDNCSTQVQLLRRASLYAPFILSMKVAQERSLHRPAPNVLIRLPYIIRLLLVCAERLFRTLPSIDTWQTRSGWSAVVRTTAVSISQVPVAARLLARDISWMRSYITSSTLTRWIRCPAAFLLGRLCKRLDHMKFEGFDDTVQRVITAWQRTPETDPRWRHIMWLRQTRDQLLSDMMSIVMEADGLARRTLFEASAKFFELEAIRAKDSVSDIQRSKRLGGIASPLVGAVPSAILVLLIKKFIPYLQ
ncbi:hypothetical protein [Microlunatus endophyticus]|uniref:hypothetical protein n=1 Tax=Microlunatus endophyticus TaxID=1716077 RepID=UPI001669ADC4|nr:hypothetical protein [Microlunatus endophyticus]